MVDEEEIRAKEQELIRQNQELEQRITISQVKQTVLDWAAAWSRQDVDAYLSYYASDFSSDDGRTPAQWREYRRDRISSPGNIEVVISDLVVDMLGSDHAQATFTQIYRSPSYGDRVKKTLLMKLEQNNWRITQEDT
jgi:murein L,D-transpeptidase YafK